MVGNRPLGDGVFAALASLVAPQEVDEPPSDDRDQPTTRIVGDAVAGPLVGGCDERLLHRILGRGEVPVTAHNRAKNLRRQMAQQVLDARTGRRSDQNSMPSGVSIGRTSTTLLAKMSPGLGQFASLAVISVARSKLSHSTIQ